MGNTSSDNAAAGFQMHHSPRLWTDRGGETEGITNLDGDLSDSGPCWREGKKKDRKGDFEILSMSRR